MSLINQMLKDLDKRRRQGEPCAEKGIPQGVQQLQQPVGVKSKKNSFNIAISPRVRLFALLVVGVIAGKYGLDYWQEWQQHSTQTQTTAKVHSISSDVHHVLTELKHHVRFDRYQVVKQAEVAKAHLEKLLDDITVKSSHEDIETLHELTTKAKAAASSSMMVNNVELHAIPGGAQLVLALSESPTYEVVEAENKDQVEIKLTNVNKATYQLIPAPLDPITDLAIDYQQHNMTIIIRTKPNTKMADVLVDKPEGIELHFAFIRTDAGGNPAAWLHQAVNDSQVKKAWVLSPTEIASHDYARALQMADRHDMTAAVTLLKKILNNVPEFVDARETLIAIYFKQKRYRNAQRLLDDGLSIDPNHVSLLTLQARLLVAKGRRKQAISLLQQHQPSIDNYPDYYAFLAALYQQNGDYLISAKLYGELVRIQPNNGLWWLGKAIGLNAYGQRTQALRAFEHAQVTPNLTPQLQAYVEEQITKLQ